jgi:hypothetical protein
MPCESPPRKHILSNINRSIQILQSMIPRTCQGRPLIFCREGSHFFVALNRTIGFGAWNERVLDKGDND